jgi:hypothetical protein
MMLANLLSVAAPAAIAVIAPVAMGMPARGTDPDELERPGLERRRLRWDLERRLLAEPGRHDPVTGQGGELGHEGREAAHAQAVGRPVVALLGEGLPRALSRSDRVGPRAGCLGTP